MHSNLLLTLPLLHSYCRLEGPVDDQHRHQVAAQHPRGLLSGTALLSRRMVHAHADQEANSAMQTGKRAGDGAARRRRRQHPVEHSAAGGGSRQAMLHWPWRSPLPLCVEDPLHLHSSMFSGAWAQLSQF